MGWLVSNLVLNFCVVCCYALADAYRVCVINDGRGNIRPVEAAPGCCHFHGCRVIWVGYGGAGSLVWLVSLLFN